MTEPKKGGARLTGRVALIGAGRMGGALAKGWLAKSRGGLKPDQVVIVDPKPGEAIQSLIETHSLTHLDALDAASAEGVQAAILAVKPQMFADVLPAVHAALPEDALAISVAAGVTLRSMASSMPGRPLVRAMPNTPAAIGRGVTVCVADEAAEARGLTAIADKLLKVAGPVEWLDDERLMGAVTGVSGSGPAYIFLFCEALARAGEAEGLPADLAERLAVATVAGAGALLEDGLKTGEADAAALRRAVTSPGGTTQAALDALTGSGGLPTLVRNAVAAAERRSRQLGAG